MNPVSYYLWKWADNDLPGKPNDVFAALMRGQIHSALQSFDATELLQQLEAAATEGRARGEEWTWKVQCDDATGLARFVYVTCPPCDNSEERVIWFDRRFKSLGLSGYDEKYGYLMQSFLPKLNSVILGQFPRERYYDITPAELPPLLKRLDSSKRYPFVALCDRHSRHLTCHAIRRRFIVEWRENYRTTAGKHFGFWRAHDPDRLATWRDGSLPALTTVADDPRLLRYADTLRICEAFLRAEPRPRRYPWRSIKKEWPY